MRLGGCRAPLKNFFFWRLAGSQCFHPASLDVGAGTAAAGRRIAIQAVHELVPLARLVAVPAAILVEGEEEGVVMEQI